MEVQGLAVIQGTVKLSICVKGSFKEGCDDGFCKAVVHILYVLNSFGARAARCQGLG